MIGSFDNIKIQGMAAAVPSFIEENMNYSSVLGERRTKKQIRLTGVAKRHVASPRQRTSDLCYRAATDLIHHLNWNKDEIKVLIMVTQTGNYNIPSTAFFLQKRLGLPKDCVVFDINLGCSSFNVGVHVVASLMQTCNLHDKALLVIGDTSGVIPGPNTPLNPDIIADRVLFGSAGAAIALEKVENNSLYFMNKSDGNGFDAIIGYKQRPTVMNGSAVFEFAINDVTEDVKKFKKHFELTEEDIDYYVFHQAQKLILDNIAADCDIPDGKELRSLEEYGNTSGTSVPVTVCASKDVISKNEKVKLFLCGFGIGLSWGAIYTEIETKNVLPIIETDEHYDEDKNPNGGLGDKNVLIIGAATPMGENIARMFDRFSAKQILCDTKLDKIKQICEDFILHCDCIGLEQFDNSMADTIVGWCQRNEKKLDGIVFVDECLHEQTYMEFIQNESFKNILAEKASIVIVSSIGNDSTAELEKIIRVWDDSFQEELIRINGICYNEADMELVQVDSSGKDWMEKYLQSGCSASMKKPIELVNVIKQLIEDDGVLISGNVIRTKG